MSKWPRMAFSRGTGNLLHETKRQSGNVWSRKALHWCLKVLTLLHLLVEAANQQVSNETSALKLILVRKLDLLTCLNRDMAPFPTCKLFVRRYADPKSTSRYVTSADFVILKGDAFYGLEYELEWQSNWTGHKTHSHAQLKPLLRLPEESLFW